MPDLWLTRDQCLLWVSQPNQLSLPWITWINGLNTWTTGWRHQTADQGCVWLYGCRSNFVGVNLACGFKPQAKAVHPLSVPQKRHCSCGMWRYISGISQYAEFSQNRRKIDKTIWQINGGRRSPEIDKRFVDDFAVTVPDARRGAEVGQLLFSVNLHLRRRLDEIVATTTAERLVEGGRQTKAEARHAECLDERKIKLQQIHTRLQFVSNCCCWA